MKHKKSVINIIPRYDHVMWSSSYQTYGSCRRHSVDSSHATKSTKSFLRPSIASQYVPISSLRPAYARSISELTGTLLSAKRNVYTSQDTKHKRSWSLRLTTADPGGHSGDGIYNDKIIFANTTSQNALKSSRFPNNLLPISYVDQNMRESMSAPNRGAFINTQLTPNRRAFTDIHTAPNRGAFTNTAVHQSTKIMDQFPIISKKQIASKIEHESLHSNAKVIFSSSSSSCSSDDDNDNDEILSTGNIFQAAENMAARGDAKKEETFRSKDHNNVRKSNTNKKQQTKSPDGRAKSHVDESEKTRKIRQKIQTELETMRQEMKTRLSREIWYQKGLRTIEELPEFWTNRDIGSTEEIARRLSRPTACTMARLAATVQSGNAHTTTRQTGKSQEPGVDTGKVKGAMASKELNFQFKDHNEKHYLQEVVEANRVKVTVNH